MQAPIPATEESVVSTDMDIEIVREKRHLEVTHSYACNSKNNGECDSGPETLTKTGTSKKKAKVNMENEPQLSLLEVQENIIRVLTLKTDEINNHMNDIKKLVNKNTMEIEGLKKSADYCFLEVADLKTENTALKSRCQALEGKMQEMEKKVNEMDAYSRRMNLKMYGISESQGKIFALKSRTFYLLYCQTKAKWRLQWMLFIVLGDTVT
uniref:Uncharacterized protein n=1 Tax=Knipowitschia caucasica TaxID=637954 RepID=A0AAV2ME13_KNICA